MVTLETGDADRQATITPFSATNSAAAIYTVQAEDFSPDLSVKGVALSGATLRDAAGNVADLAIPAGQNLNDNKDIVVRTTYTITASKTGNGAITPEGAVAVAHNGATNFLIAADPGHHIKSIKTNGTDIAESPYPDNALAAANYVWSNIVADGTIAAGFAANRYTLTVVSAHYGADPGTLTTNWGSELIQRVTNSPVAGGEGTQYVCVAASVLGNAYAQVSPTNVFLTLTNNATPTWQWSTNYWLAEHGLTNRDWDAEAMDDQDHDGMPTWQEHIADTDPTNRDSVLCIVGFGLGAGGIRVERKGGQTATQFLEHCGDLCGSGNTWIAIFTNLPATTTATNIVDGWRTNGALFYRVEAVR